MGKPKPETDKRAKQKDQKRVEKKGTEEKKRSEGHKGGNQEGKRLSNQNGTLHNGHQPRKENNRKGKGKSNVQSRKWSCLGIFNWILLTTVLLSAVGCAFVYTEGDFSAEGLQTAWGKLQQNSAVLYKTTKQTVNYENMRSVVMYTRERTAQLWTVIAPYALILRDALIVGLTWLKATCISIYQIIESYTGDLSPYLDGLKPLWNNLVSYFVWFINLSIEYVSNINWEWVISGVRFFIDCVRSVYLFLADQMRVLNAEFWRNEAIASGWKDLKPVRDSLWENTANVRLFISNVWEDIQSFWIPFVKKEVYKMYLSGRDTVQIWMS